MSERRRWVRTLATAGLSALVACSAGGRACTPAREATAEKGRPLDGPVGGRLDAHEATAERYARFPVVSVQPGGIYHWDTPYFANALYASPGWSHQIQDGPWERVSIWRNPRFDRNGYPRYLAPGERLRAPVYGGGTAGGRLARGQVVLTWEGLADLRLGPGGAYLPEASSGPERGVMKDGRRVYLFSKSSPRFITLEALEPSAPPTSIRVWLPDPTRPEVASLERRRFHPTFLARLADEDWGVARLMTWLVTNASPEQDWSDRRLPGHAFMTGVLHPRPPALGFEGDRDTGVAYEHLVALCNETGLDLWLTVPHRATDVYVKKLAQLVRFGSDGAEPHVGPQADRAWAPLRSDLRVWVEYSNEIWSRGNAFPQGDWAQRRAERAGITKAEHNARRFAEVWSIFQRIFEGSERLVRVAAVFAAGEGYTRPFLEELRRYGPSLDPPVEPDVVSPTTYFGNGMQDFVFEQDWLDDVDETYWSSVRHEAHLEAAFDEWVLRLLAKDARQGAGPDATGNGGGYGAWLHALARTAFAEPKPIVAYEGGPSIYTHRIEARAPIEGAAVTRFMAAMNRHPRMAEVYRIHLNMAHAKGLVSHSPFVLVGPWTKYGQFGHLESLDQRPEEAVKYRFVRAWHREALGLRPVDASVGGPRFTTSAALPAPEQGVEYEVEVTVDGKGPLTVEVIGQRLPGGLSVRVVEETPPRLLIEGTPRTGGEGYVYARVVDPEGRLARRTFTIPWLREPGGGAENDFGSSQLERR